MAAASVLSPTSAADLPPADLRRALEWMDLALSTITEAVAWSDADGSVEWCNAAFEALVGLHRSGLTGSRLIDLLPLERHGQRVSIENHPVTRGASGARVSAELYKLVGSPTRHVEVSARALNQDGGPSAAVVIIRDVTRRREREKTVLRQQEFLELLQRVTGASNDADGEVQAIQTVLELVCARTGWRLGHASLFPRANEWESLIPTATWYMACPQAEQLRAWLQQRPFCISNIAFSMVTQGKPIHFPLSTPLGEVIATAIPIVCGPDMVGMLEFYCSERHIDDLEELGQIGVQLGRVIERKRAEHELREAHAELELRVMDRTFELAEANNALRRENEERRKAEAMKDELVATVSHELRTPLASLMGFAELMLDHDFPRQEQREFLQVIHQESTRLTELINDFLDLQRIEAGRMECLIEPMDLRPLLEETARLFTKEDSTHRIVVETSRLPRLLGDGKRLRQVLTNLVSNAVKFSPKGGRVLLSATVDSGQVVVMVEDQGIGIPADMIPNLFQKFFRVDNADTRSIGGTGLGLALIKEIVRLHKGDIWVESQPGFGSRFFFTVPVCESC
jgi:PAS domain S-box-containing protein